MASEAAGVMSGNHTTKASGLDSEISNANISNGKPSDSNTELPVLNSLTSQLGGIDNKAFEGDASTQSKTDEESRRTFLPTNGKKPESGANEKESCGDAVDECVNDPDSYCGIGSCRPSAVQRCKTMGCFAACFSIAGLVTSALNVYINSQITTLEKHFNFSSSVSGFLMSCNDLGYLITTLFMSYYARRVHIPRALALSSILYGVSGLMCTVAFFGTRDQIPTPPKIGDSVAGNTLKVAQMCENVTSSINATCEEISLRAAPGIDISDSWRTGAIFIIAVGMIVQGIAKSPRQAFLGTYVDDNVPKTKTTMYLGTIVGLSIFGPAVAFTLGGVFSKTYITLEETSMTPRDPRWLGAWWLGFLAFGGAGLVVGIPLIFFPKRMTKRKELEDIRQKQKLERMGYKSILHEFIGFLKAVFRLLRNPIYVLVILSTGISLMGVSGMLAFMPKYIETQFTVPAWQANIMLGAMNVFAASMGTVIGGCLTSRFKLSPIVCLKVKIACMLSAGIILSLGFVVGCDQPVIEDGLAYESTANPLADSCIKGCNCDQQNFFPICGSDGTNYFSPCHAGCTSVGDSTDFANCSCLSTNETMTAVAGLCETKCNSLYPYALLTFFGALATTMTIMPGFVVSVRSVKEADKPLAIGLSAFSGTLIGWFPGPVIFGALVDTTCMIWKTTCASVGACSLYSLPTFRFRFHGLMVGLRVINVALLVTAFLIARCSKTPVFQPHRDSIRNHSQKKKKSEDANVNGKENEMTLVVTPVGEIRETNIL